MWAMLFTSFFALVIVWPMTEDHVTRAGDSAIIADIGNQEVQETKSQVIIASEICLGQTKYATRSFSLRSRESRAIPWTP